MVFCGTVPRLPYRRDRQISDEMKWLEKFKFAEKDKKIGVSRPRLREHSGATADVFLPRRRTAMHIGRETNLAVSRDYAKNGHSTATRVDHTHCSNCSVLQRGAP